MSEPQSEISWDPAKAKANLAKHDVSFTEAASILLDPLSLTVFDVPTIHVMPLSPVYGLFQRGLPLGVSERSMRPNFSELHRYGHST